jgi:hypothetical protein
MPDTTAPRSADELREAQIVEYGTFVAAQTIFINGARAFNVGDPVPVSHVDRGVVNPDEVVKPSTKSGREALRAVGLDYPEPVEAPAPSPAPTSNDKSKG